MINIIIVIWTKWLYLAITIRIINIQINIDIIIVRRKWTFYKKNSVKNQTNKKISKSKSSNNENNCKVFDNNDIFYTLRSIQYVYLIYSRYFLTCFLRSIYGGSWSLFLIFKTNCGNACFTFSFVCSQFTSLNILAPMCCLGLSFNQKWIHLFWVTWILFIFWRTKGYQKIQLLSKYG